MMDYENKVRTVILYESKYGTAERYANMLAGMRDADVMRASEAKLTKLRDYRTIILIGAIYNGTILGADTLKRYYAKLKQQDSQNEATQQYDQIHRYAVLAVGAAPEENAMRGATAQLPGELSEIPLFYARGVFDRAKLNAGDALRIQLMSKALASERAEIRKNVPDWLVDLLAEDEPRDFVDEVYLEPLCDVIDGRF